MAKYKVRLRGGFSDRNNISIENREMQYESLDDRTRTMLINRVSVLLKQVSYNDQIMLHKSILVNVYAWEVDDDEIYIENEIKDVIYQTIRENTYDEVFSLLEFLVQKIQKIHPWTGKDYEELFNDVFKNEYVGYRFVNSIIVPITNETEIETINQSAGGPYSIVNTHISKAITLLSDREHPDYENSIKESISAVEAICEIITGLKGKEATLGKMIKKIEDDGIVIHTALKTAFSTLYGYTSDANGIRHAGDIGGSLSTFEEAKFMLVSCCAFINYLIGISAK
ncbi:MAG: hypothetical protein K2N01_13300 [Lachnospiraceae bacterium]|nr:hypothetical protein [Lachnospiraceae bacterium]